MALVNAPPFHTITTILMVMELERAIEHALDGSAVLFTGAGFSLGATNLQGTPFKTAREFSKHLASTVGIADEVGLEVAAEEFADAQGKDALLAELQQEFTCREFADHHGIIAALPWKRVYTTNYDNVFETAAAARGHPVTTVSPGDDLRALSKNALLTVHLNGYVGRLSRHSLLSDLKLTEGSYLSASIAQSPWASLFREDIGLARAVLFVGYSLSDLDLQRILFESISLRDKLLFVLGKDPSPLTERRVARFGSILPISGDALGTRIAATQRAYTPLEDAGQIGSSIRKVEVPRQGHPITDKDVFSLLLEGVVRRDAVARSLAAADAHYFLERSASMTVIEKLLGGDVAVVVHSDLGNGKSMLLEGIKLRAVGLGFDVYEAFAHSDATLLEAETVLRTSKRPLLLVEDYVGWFELIRYFALHASDRGRMVLTARSYIHDVVIDRLLDALGTATVPEISVDHMREPEVARLASWFDEYGLWAERAAWSQKRKQQFLHEQCRGEFQAILVKLLEAPQIRARFADLFGKLNERRSYYAAAVAVLILSVLDYSPSTDMLADLCGEGVLESEFRRDPVIMELIDVERSEVRFRSSVVARFVLSSVADPNITVDVLEIMARAANKLSRQSNRYFELLKGLMRFSNLQLVFPEQQRRLAIIRYYEAIKGLEGCVRNPLFWLQYAIACVTLGELERAGRYFATAYALADARDHFNSYQIDNHYARYLLVNAVRQNDPANAMAAFREARKIIETQTNEERRHYPYHVASNYEEFADAFGPLLHREERREFLRAVKTISERIVGLPDERQRHPDVVKCREAMDRIAVRAAAWGDAPVK